jgi:hypothetical protein
MQRVRRGVRAAKKLRTNASTRAYDLMNNALEGSKSGVVDIGLNVGHKIVTPIVRYHVTAALGGTDPELPNSVRKGMDLLAEDICVSVEIKILEALRQNVGGTSPSAKYKDPVGAGCCRPNCCSWMRTTVLYTLYPYDRSIWSQLRDPWFFLFKIFTVFPMFCKQFCPKVGGVCMVVVVFLCCCVLTSSCGMFFWQTSPFPRG